MVGGGVILRVILVRHATVHNRPDGSFRTRKVAWRFQQVCLEGIDEGMCSGYLPWHLSWLF